MRTITSLKTGQARQARQAIGARQVTSDEVEALYQAGCATVPATTGLRRRADRLDDRVAPSRAEAVASGRGTSGRYRG